MLYVIFGLENNAINYVFENIETKNNKNKKWSFCLNNL